MAQDKNMKDQVEQAVEMADEALEQVTGGATPEFEAIPVHKIDMNKASHVVKDSGVSWL